VPSISITATRYSSLVGGLHEPAARILARAQLQPALGQPPWHFARLPVQDLDYEMDVRGVAREILL
jgi:hypothetical protein